MRVMLVGATMLVLASGLYIFAGFAQSLSDGSTSALKIDVQTAKSSFILGEGVPLEIRVRNEGSSDVRVPGLGVKSGYVKVWIADSKGKYAEYTNATWGNAKTPPAMLNAGQEVLLQATILANAKRETAHLSEFWRKRATENKILTSYAFPKADVYYIKVVLHVPGDNPCQIESQPIQITINEPLGEDLEVWKKIKDRVDFAFFLQESQNVLTDEKGKEKFEKEIGEIIDNYPNSQLVQQAKASRERLRANEEKLRKYKDNVNQQDPVN